MLNKFVIRLKNIIFFKGILYCLSIILLSFLLTNVERELNTSKIYLQNTQDQLSKAKNIMNTIDINAEAWISNYKIYNSKSVIDNCKNRASLLSIINEISKKYSIQEPIIRIHSSLDNNDSVFANYDIQITLSGHAIQQIISLSNEIYNLMPKNSYITDMNIIYQEALTPELIKSLSNNHTLENIQCKFNIRILEIKG